MTQNKTLNAKIITSLENNDYVYNINFPNYKRLGQVVEKDGKFQVKFWMQQKNDFRFAQTFDNWEKLPNNIRFVDFDQDIEILPDSYRQLSEKIAIQDTILESEKAKESYTIKPSESVNILDAVLKATKGEKVIDNNQRIENVLPVKTLSQDELNELKALEREYFKNDKTINELESLVLRQCRILSIIRDKQLWVNSIDNTGKVFDSFIEYGIFRFGNTRVATQENAKVGDFLEYVSINQKILEMSFNSANKVITSYNVFADKFGFSKEIKDAKPLLENVISITENSLQNDNKRVKVTPKNIENVYSIIDSFFDGLTEKPSDITRASNILNDNKISLVSNVKTKLAEKPQPKTEQQKEIKTIDGLIELMTEKEFLTYAKSLYVELLTKDTLSISIIKN